MIYNNIHPLVIWWWTKISWEWIPSVSKYHWDLSVVCHTSEWPYHKFTCTRKVVYLHKVSLQFGKTDSFWRFIEKFSLYRTEVTHIYNAKNWVFYHWQGIFWQFRAILTPLTTNEDSNGVTFVSMYEVCGVLYDCYNVYFCLFQGLQFINWQNLKLKFVKLGNDYSMSFFKFLQIICQ